MQFDKVRIEPKLALSITLLQRPLIEKKIFKFTNELCIIWIFYDNKLYDFLQKFNYIVLVANVKKNYCENR